MISDWALALYNDNAEWDKFSSSVKPQWGYSALFFLLKGLKDQDNILKFTMASRHGPLVLFIVCADGKLARVTYDPLEKGNEKSYFCRVTEKGNPVPIWVGSGLSEIIEVMKELTA